MIMKKLRASDGWKRVRSHETRVQSYNAGPKL